METPPGAQRPQAIGSALLQTPSSATASAANSVPQAAYTPSLGDTFQKLKVLSLFAGIGGFDLGLERTGGFETVAFCEIEPFAQRVLAKHWPHVPCYSDVRELTSDRLAADGIAVDVICGGFPCQDLSIAGSRVGIEGARSGLWSEIVRLARDIRPSIIVLENVANLLSGPSERPGRWFGRVLGDLAELGYDAEWENIPAEALGAPHTRERVWVVAHTDEIGCGSWRDYLPDNPGFEQWEATQGKRQWADLECWLRTTFQDCDGTAAASELLGIPNGLPDRLERCAALGNAVVPQIPELIGNAILKSIDHTRGDGAELLASSAVGSKPFHSPEVSHV